MGCPDYVTGSDYVGTIPAIEFGSSKKSTIIWHLVEEATAEVVVRHGGATADEHLREPP